MVWSQYLYLLSGIACSTLRPTRYLMNTMLTSPTSIALDCDRKRFNRSAFSVACIWIVKPNSLLACSSIFGIAPRAPPPEARPPPFYFLLPGLRKAPEAPRARREPGQCRGALQQ